MKKKKEIVKMNEVEFHDQTLLTAEVDGEFRVIMKPIVEGMGLYWAAQFVKLKNDREKFNCFDIETVGSDGKIRKMLSMPLKKLPGWFLTINPNKVKKEIRDIVIRYQEECFAALYDYWHKGKAENPRFKGKSKKIDHIKALRLLKSFIESYICVGYNKSAAMIMSMDNLLDQYGYDYPAALQSTKEKEEALIVKKYGPAFKPDPNSKAPQYHTEDKLFYGWLCMLLSDASLWRSKTSLSIAGMHRDYDGFCRNRKRRCKNKNAWSRKMNFIFDGHIKVYQRRGRSGRYYKFSEFSVCREQFEKHIGNSLEYFTKEQCLTIN